MQNVVCSMTLIQAQIPESEYRLLRQRAVATGQPMKEVIRQALHVYLADDTVNPKDPIFHIFPLGASGRKGHRIPELHDEALYGHAR
jgi:ribbon-helix-helix CopG family protein